MANKRSGNHIITTAVEHPAVTQPALFLQEQGFEVTYLPVDSRGVVKLDALEAVLRPDTILVSVMYVNNEVGAVMPVEEIGRRMREKSRKRCSMWMRSRHLANTESIRKKSKLIFFLSAAIKIHGPKEVGLLHPIEKAKIQPQILGGGQQSGMRSGTRRMSGNCRTWSGSRRNIS